VTILPLDTSTFWSLTHALLMWWMVWLARRMPSRMASSKLEDDSALISTVFATDMRPPCVAQSLLLAARGGAT